MCPLRTTTVCNDSVKRCTRPLIDTRLARDKRDLAKLAARLFPFSDEVTLRNIMTGIYADTKSCQCTQPFIVGKDAVTKVEGQAVCSYSHKRADAVKTLASTRAVTVDNERGIDPALLFQRFQLFHSQEIFA